MRRAAAGALLVVLVAHAVPAGAARVNVAQVQRAAWVCAAKVRARSWELHWPSAFDAWVVPKRDGTVSVQAVGTDDETAWFHRCLRAAGTVFDEEPGPRPCSDPRNRASWWQLPCTGPRARN
jgi:hypothetical protein